MKEFEQKRQKTERISLAVGIALTVSLHVAVICLCSFNGIKYLYPPPPENSFLLDFSVEEESPKTQKYQGHQPRGEKVDKTEPVNLVQKSESPYKTLAENNITPETKPDDFGDVETPAPEVKEPELNPKATFPGMNKKDTSVTAPHSATDPRAEFKGGQVHGNTLEGAITGMPNVHVKGRTVEKASLIKPSYTVQASGIVVVKIWVDQYGNVKNAIAGADGTTVTNKELWKAARNAAFKAHFNTDGDAPALQEGTITYIFNLK